MLAFRFISLAFLLIAASATAQQYRSMELVKPDSEAEKKSVAELEAGLKNLDNPYAKASTMRYLARHYLEKNQLKKAEVFYIETLSSDGLSDIAKQDILEELASLYMRMKRYEEALKILDERKSKGGKQDFAITLMRAMANHQLGRDKTAIKLADSAWAMNKYPKPAALRQLRFIYFHNKAYSKALDTQKRLLQINPNEIQDWRYLAAIYIRKNQHGKAADSLMTARQKEIPLNESDYNLLADLYTKAGNPYMGARMLEEGIDKNIVESNAEYLDKLFAYWLMAKERQGAIRALQKAIAMKPTIERFLQMAQLQHQQQQWPEMKESVIKACKMDLPDWHVSEANLLLGISELKLGNRAEARGAFINATLVGGEGHLANQYLDYMDAEAASKQEAAAFFGSCTPKWARKSSREYSVRLAETDNFFSDEQAIFGELQRVDYEIKTGKKQTLVVRSYSIPFVELEKKILPNAIRLGMYINKNGGQINGNMHFIFPKPIKVGEEVLNFEMAFPVSRKPMAKGAYRVIEDGGFKAASAVFEGPPEKMITTWINFYSTVLADGLDLTGKSRQVVLDAEPGNTEKIKMQFQIGVK